MFHKLLNRDIDYIKYYSLLHHVLREIQFYN